MATVTAPLDKRLTNYEAVICFVARSNVHRRTCHKRWAK